MQNKAANYRDLTLRRFELYLFPWIGKTPISDLTAPDMLTAVKRIQNQNKFETAYRTLQACGQVFRYAVQSGRAIRDVTADLRGALPPTTTKHMVTFTEPKNVAKLLRAIDGFTGTLTGQKALRLAPLVFVRPSELRCCLAKLRGCLATFCPSAITFISLALICSSTLRNAY